MEVLARHLEGAAAPLNMLTTHTSHSFLLLTSSVLATEDVEPENMVLSERLRITQRGQSLASHSSDEWVGSAQTDGRRHQSSFCQVPNIAEICLPKLTRTSSGYSGVTGMSRDNKPADKYKLARTPCKCTGKQLRPKENSLSCLHNNSIQT